MIGGVNLNNGFQNQTGSVRLNQNTTHEQTYEEDSKVVNAVDQVVSYTQDEDDEINELGSDDNDAFTEVAMEQPAKHLKFIASLKAELESARALITTQKA